MNGKFLLGIFYSIYVYQSLVCAEKMKYEGHQLWRIIPENAESIKILQQMGEAFSLDFWKDPIRMDMPVEIRVPPNQVNELRKQLESKGIHDIKVSVSNIQSLIDNEQRTQGDRGKLDKATKAFTLESFDYTSYHPAEEVYEWMDQVLIEFNFVTKKQIGVTYQGRPMYALIFKKPSADGSTKPVIFVDSLIHCREWITTASLLFIFKEMLLNTEFASMMDEVDWYFVPMINIDGYVETWTGDRLWRKTRSVGASSICTGVDANRNWDDNWSGPGASGNPCSLTYYGPTAASESEVRHLANYIMDMKEDISAYVSVHSYSQLILYPYNYDYVLTEHDELLNSVGKVMSDAIYSKHQKKYVWGPGASTLYIFSGVTTDWTYNKAGIPLSFIYELRDTGEHGFLLPPEQIVPTGEEFLLGFKALADHVIENGSGKQ